jgi:peptide deformylase
MKKIVQNGDPVLRASAKEVPLADIKTEKIAKVLEEMKAALAGEHDGVAIAAPQIGYSLRIFVVSSLVLRKMKLLKDTEVDDLVFINPVITKLSREKKWVEEGCLSVRWLYGKVKRATKASVEAYDEHGNKFERGGAGLLAQIFQHETDHLNGALFIDTAKDLEEVDPAELQAHDDDHA